MIEGLEFFVCVCCVSILLASVENRIVGGHISKFTPLNMVVYIVSKIESKRYTISVAFGRVSG